MLGLYFGGQWFQTKFGNSLGNIELDAVLDEAHEWQAEATMNPVEEGSPVSDHIIEQPDKLKIRGFVSETPLVASESVRGAKGTPWAESLTQPLFDLLRDLIKAREPMTVYTKYRIYDNMVLTNLTIPRSAATGEALEFTAEFVHIRKVATQTVDVPPGISAKNDAKSSPSLSRKTQPQKNAGKKQPETIDIYKNRSFAKRLTDMSQGKGTGPDFRGRVSVP
jgi:hypothetical protein